MKRRQRHYQNQWGKRLPDNSFPFHIAANKGNIKSWQLGKLVNTGLVIPFYCKEGVFISHSIIKDLSKLWGLYESGDLEDRI